MKKVHSAEVMAMCHWVIYFFFSSNIDYIDYNSLNNNI